MSLGAWSAVTLTTHQAQTLAHAYGEGQFDTELLLNRYQTDPWLALARLDLLPQPILDPVHFTFEGNRTYAMQLVTNGACHGLAYHQQVEANEENAPWVTYRLELIHRAELPFLSIRPPGQRALASAALDWFASRVQAFQALGLPPPLEAFGHKMARWPVGWGELEGDLSARIDRILAGVHPGELFDLDQLAVGLGPAGVLA